MKIKSIDIENFRLFENLKLSNIGIPDGEKGSGITVFVGENGCGKTTILDAVALPLLEYKSDNFSIYDFHDPKKMTKIKILTESDFNYDGTMPKAIYKGKGFIFEAKKRQRVNAAYLSSMVASDQKFIRADGVSKPTDNSPDLRINVNNPFKGVRFNENDVLYLDKNRTFQIRSGTYNSTKFDRLMEDFNYQYIQSCNECPPDLNDECVQTKIKSKIEHQFFEETIREFCELTELKIRLNLLDNWRPFKNAFLAENKNNKLQINLSSQGSGFDMIFALIYSFNLAKQSKKQLIILIDEPELHMHPKLQLSLVRLLIKMSVDSQILLTTHSPLLVKQIMENELAKIIVIKKTDDVYYVEPTKKRVLPYISANEINYLAFQLATAEYHNELYGCLQNLAIVDDRDNYNETSFNTWLDEKGCKQTKVWKKINSSGKYHEQTCVLQIYIRNFIHHPENKNNEKFSDNELKQSIDEMRKIIAKINISA